MNNRYPMEEIEAALDVADIAAEIVALWESPNIKGLPRAERNTTIEGTREKLIAAVREWQQIKAARP
jgi:ABC-type phosphate/phosphonate transport system substrate-binding protein